MATNVACDRFWVDKYVYHDAERKYHESLAKLLRNGQKEVNKNGQKYEENSNKKAKESKNPKSQTKKNNNPDNVNVDVLKREIDSVGAKNTKNNSLNTVIDCNKKESIEVVKSKEDPSTFDKDQNGKDFDKKVKQKDAKEKKNKSEKKSKKIKEKEEKKMGGVGMENISQETIPKSSLAGEVAKARQHLKSSLECMDGIAALAKNNDPKLQDVESSLYPILAKLQTSIQLLEKRVEVLEKKCATCVAAAGKATSAPAPAPADNEDDVDLFGSESEEEDEGSKQVREQRLAEYAAKKSKKPVLIAKSNIILDVKPWDDETNMKEMEQAVRAIQMDGLIWGASKLVPLAYGIHKLQISCVVEDDKVSVDQLTENLEEIENYIQSVDIAAFNKV